MHYNFLVKKKQKHKKLIQIIINTKNIKVTV